MRVEGVVLTEAVAVRVVEDWVVMGVVGMEVGQVVVVAARMVMDVQVEMVEVVIDRVV